MGTAEEADDVDRNYFYEKRDRKMTVKETARNKIRGEAPEKSKAVFSVAVTGSTGFVGKALCDSLTDSSRYVRKVVRNPGAGEAVAVGEIGPDTQWCEALDGIDVVVHLAARVHVMREHAKDPMAEFRRVNVQGTANLARQAVRMGVRRFVYLSSVKVNGEATLPKRPYCPGDQPAPRDPYAVSKLEAELELRRIARETGLDVVIIRPSLVYGPGVRANFYRMMQAIHSGMLIPLGAVRNKRSLVATDNLLDLIATCIDHPAAAGETFLVSDGEDISTPELIRRIARSMGRPARLFYVPIIILRMGGRMTGRLAEIDRLTSSLQVDISHTREILGWHPPVTMAVALRETVRDFMTAVAT